MNVELLQMIERYASMVLEWLDMDAHEHRLHRTALVEHFVETLTALNQIKKED